MSEESARIRELEQEVENLRRELDSLRSDPIAPPPASFDSLLGDRSVLEQLPDIVLLDMKMGDVTGDGYDDLITQPLTFAGSPNKAHGIDGFAVYQAGPADSSKPKGVGFNQLSDDVSNAIERRTAISGLTPARPFSTAESVFLLTPSALAASTRILA